MTRLWMIGVAIAAAAIVRFAPVHAQQPARASFSIVEATIADTRAALEQGRVTSRDIVAQSLLRIALYEDRLHGALYVNPRAIFIEIGRAHV